MTRICCARRIKDRGRLQLARRGVERHRPDCPDHGREPDARLQLRRLRGPPASARCCRTRPTVRSTAAAAAVSGAWTVCGARRTKWNRGDATRSANPFGALRYRHVAHLLCEPRTFHRALRVQYERGVVPRSHHRGCEVSAHRSSRSQADRHSPSGQRLSVFGKNPDNGCPLGVCAIHDHRARSPHRGRGWFVPRCVPGPLGARNLSEVGDTIRTCWRAWTGWWGRWTRSTPRCHPRRPGPGWVVEPGPAGNPAPPRDLLAPQ